MFLGSFFGEHGKALKIRNREFLTRQGECDTRAFWLESGLLKATYVTEDGREFVKSFFEEGSLLGSLRAQFEGIPNPFSLQALENCSLYAVDMLALRHKAACDLTLSNALLEAMLALAIKKERRELEFLTLSAEERYGQMIRCNPGLVQRITQNDVARYLGITPVALSRIRNRIRFKGFN
ncbi:MAG: Crp/Fnr family transcriptional regulator [Puniceicoccaceae bacterium]